MYHNMKWTYQYAIGLGYDPREAVLEKNNPFTSKAALLQWADLYALRGKLLINWYLFFLQIVRGRTRRGTPRQILFTALCCAGGSRRTRPAHFAFFYYFGLSPFFSILFFTIFLFLLFPFSFFDFLFHFTFFWSSKCTYLNFKFKKL